MKFKKVQLKKDLIINAVIASIIVQQAPKLLNQYFFSSSPLTGITLEVAGGAAAYLVGMLFGKTDIANIGIAIAIADIANDLLMPSLLGATTGKPAGVGDYSSSPLLRDYGSNPNAMSSAVYSSAYN